jgi:hypothetical protein
MPLSDIIGDFFGQVIWDGAFRFFGSCIRVIYTKESFSEALKNEKSSNLGFVLFLLVLIIVIVFFLD